MKRTFIGLVALMFVFSTAIAENQSYAGKIKFKLNKLKPEVPHVVKQVVRNVPVVGYSLVKWKPMKAPIRPVVRLGGRLPIVGSTIKSFGNNKYGVTPFRPVGKLFRKVLPPGVGKGILRGLGLN